jgi:hypothetical protein
MALFDSKVQSASNWAAVAHAGSLAPAPAAPTSNLASVLLQGAVEQRSLSQNGWFDVEFINFSFDTWQFINITEGDIETGLRNHTHAVGKLLYTFGAAKEEFRFADPVEDVRQIKKGIIRYLRPVTEAEILKLLTDAGVFDYSKKTAHTSWSRRYDYIIREGRGAQRLDFSTNPKGMRQIAKPETNYVSVPNGVQAVDVTPFLFYVEGVAHNWFNFGNFLFGAAGATLGFNAAEIAAGAQYNSLVNNEENGYAAQLDSEDDQFSIGLGYAYAKARHYTSRVQRQWGKPRLL